MLFLAEVAGTATGITDAQATALAGSLQSFGGLVLDNFIKLLPALAVLAAIMFIIGIVRRKMRS